MIIWHGRWELGEGNYINYRIRYNIGIVRNRFTVQTQRDGKDWKSMKHVATNKELSMSTWYGFTTDTYGLELLP